MVRGFFFHYDNTERTKRESVDFPNMKELRLLGDYFPRPQTYRIQKRMEKNSCIGGKTLSF